MKHAALIPLVGGAAIGASLALDRPPEYLASWDTFAKNDSFCAQYFDKRIFRFDRWDTKQIRKKVDIVTCVPPCSGLSTATPSSARGCKAPQNEHMLKVAEIGMVDKTQWIVIENAPALYSQAGAPFAERFLPLCKKYGYTMLLYKTSTILHGLPQNRVRSFVILTKGDKVPNLEPVNLPYKPLYKWKRTDGTLSSDWDPVNDEMVNVIDDKLGIENVVKILLDGPMSMWTIFNKHRLKHKFKTKPYEYMQKTAATGQGIMDRSPILVNDYSNALMWKSAHRMLNPATDYARQFSIRELMRLMGLPDSFEEIPRKDINVLFQNVPVNTVKTLVESIVSCDHYFKPRVPIVRFNNIKQQYE